MRLVHEIYLVVDVFATGDADRDEAHEDDEQIKEVVIFDLVAPHEDGHLQDGLEAGLEEGFQDLELHGPDYYPLVFWG